MWCTDAAPLRVTDLRASVTNRRRSCTDCVEVELDPLEIVDGSSLGVESAWVGQASEGGSFAVRVVRAGDGSPATRRREIRSIQVE
jgi:hypothetical protein